MSVFDCCLFVLCLLFGGCGVMRVVHCLLFVVCLLVFVVRC